MEGSTAGEPATKAAAAAKKTAAAAADSATTQASAVTPAVQATPAKKAPSKPPTGTTAPPNRPAGGGPVRSAPSAPQRPLTTVEPEPIDLLEVAGGAAFDDAFERRVGLPFTTFETFVLR